MGRSARQSAPPEALSLWDSSAGSLNIAVSVCTSELKSCISIPGLLLVPSLLWAWSSCKGSGRDLFHQLFSRYHVTTSTDRNPKVKMKSNEWIRFTSIESGASPHPRPSVEKKGKLIEFQTCTILRAAAKVNEEVV